MITTKSQKRNGTAPDGPSRAGATIWQFTAGGGWSRVASPLPEGSGDFDKVMRSDGWHHSTNYGTDETFPHLELYEHDDGDRLLVLVCLPDQCHEVLVPDLPSLLKLLEYVLPVITRVMECDRAEREYTRDVRERQRKYATGWPRKGVSR